MKQDSDSDSDSGSESDNISISSSDNETIASICMSDAVSEVSYCDIFPLENLTNDDIAEIIMDIYEQIDNYVQENILKISLPTFYSDVCRDIAETIYMEWEVAGICDEDVYNDIIELVNQIMDTYQQANLQTQRSTSNAECKLSSEEINALSQQIQHLQSLLQPEQRTPEWYEFRNGLITASNLWKVFGSQSQQNSLIYEKCKSIVTSDSSTVDNRPTNTNTPMHWGVKYEPVTVMLYENMYQTKIGEFGCIQHPDYSFIGASPDGINIDPTSHRFGRMLEIKNIVNRNITGIPKEEYWVQTQIQMETCNLDKCDFVETRIKEYPTEEEFYNDTLHDYKGVILHFITRGLGSNDEPIYRYMPLDINIEPDAIQTWINATKADASTSNQFLFTTIYWYLDEMSCVLIERNRKWFATAVTQIQSIWDTILLERSTGYEHRAPKKRIPKILVETNDTSGVHTIQNMPNNKKICLIKLDL